MSFEPKKFTRSLSSFYVTSALVGGASVACSLFLLALDHADEQALKTKAEQLAGKLVSGQAPSSSAASEFSNSDAYRAVLTASDGKVIASFSNTPKPNPAGSRFKQFDIPLNNGLSASVVYPLPASSPWLPMLLLLGTAAALPYLAHLSLLLPLSSIRRQINSLSIESPASPLKDSSPLTAAQMTEFASDLSKSLSTLSESYQTRIKQLQSEFSAKEKFAKLAINKISRCQSTQEALDILMGWIAKEFPETHFQFVLLVAPEKETALIKTVNLNSAAVQRLLTVVPGLSKRLSTSEVSVIDGETLVGLGLTKVDESGKCGQLFSVHILKAAENNLYLCGTLRTPVPTLEKYVRNLFEFCSPQMEAVARYEAENRKARTDALTGLANLHELNDYCRQVERIGKEGSAEIQVTAILVEGDTLAAKSAEQEQALKELARILSQKINPRAISAGMVLGDKLIRYDEGKLLALVEGLQRSQILSMGQELSEAIRASGLPLIRLAVARFPEQGSTLEDVIRCAQVGIEYSRNENLSGYFVDTVTLPAAFKSSRLGSNSEVKPEEQFDPFDLFLTMELSRQTALLKVTSPEGRKCWVFVHDGIPARAGLGKLGGKDAIVELLATFKQGTVQFHNEKELDKNALEEMAPSDACYTVADNVADLLAEGARAKTNYDKARLSFTDTKLHVFPCPFSSQIWERLARTCTDEMPLMKKILLLATAGSKNCLDIVAAMDDLPSHKVWRAMSLLLSNKMIRLSRLKLQSVGPEFAGPSVYCQHCHTRHPAGLCTMLERTPAVGSTPVAVPVNDDSLNNLKIDPNLPLENQLLGKIIASKYRIDSLIGEGGMAKVFKATHVGLDREVVIKIMQVLSSVDTDLKRFERECKVTAKINHPNVISVFDVGTLEANRPYLVMEFIQGESLRQYLDREGCMSPEDAAIVMIQICCGLAEAHSKGVVHRDLKPENIMLRSQPDRPDWVKIVDFGIAHLRHTGTHFTRGGMAVGTVDYMSPEYLCDKPVDHRADVYALGIVLYELLTGRCTFQAQSMEEMFAKHISAAPLPLSHYRPDLPAGCMLDQIAQKALQKNPEHRYASVTEMRADLEQALSEMLVGTQTQT